MCRRYVSIWFPHLVTDWCTLQRPQLANTAFVLSAPSHGRMLVTAANALAEAKGIHAGMALAEARAMFPLIASA
jgi:protein ImuB